MPDAKGCRGDDAGFLKIEKIGLVPVDQSGIGQLTQPRDSPFSVPCPRDTIEGDESTLPLLTVIDLTV